MGYHLDRLKCLRTHIKPVGPGSSPNVQLQVFRSSFEAFKRGGKGFLVQRGTDLKRDWWVGIPEMGFPMRYKNTGGQFVRNHQKDPKRFCRT